ncbi:mitochondrial genome maintenance exonuclease 1 [Bombina bombina]|uniref:mitochondrial genome maintenance exonuclease 1 n=1 Tax=Bombina bombina TaxID=8345 RepID=UPI00235A6B0D|nr:mitochondrial genome maintenance exonuclease 1 [Bombina bombina]XP_053567964.1 mitochondrial genome maintenance exonuclease 1 [Bombina bombina]
MCKVTPTLFTSVLEIKPLQLINKFGTLCNGLQQNIYCSAFLSSSCSHLSRKKKVNAYEEVNQEKYANLVRTVTSSRVSHQTPDSLFREDSFLYGKVVKSKLESQVTEEKLPQSFFPLTNLNKLNVPVDKAEPNIPIKISLPGRSQMTNGKVPSVTRILQQTMPMEQAFYLERWKQRMIMELGEKGFIEYTAALFSQGKLFHATLEDLLLSQDYTESKHEESEQLSGYLASVQHVLADVVGVRTLESAVHHSALQYLGLVDCVAKYRDKLCVIDWKTSEKPKPYLRDTFDNPLQVAAYVGAVNHDENYNFQVDCGLIVVAYKDGSPAHSHFMDSNLCLHYWKKWLLRLEEYNEKKEEKQ